MLKESQMIQVCNRDTKTGKVGFLYNAEIPENFDDNKTEVLRILSSKLSEAGSKYSAIGIQLLNNAARINEIETEMRGKNVEHCLSRTLTEWININDGNAPLPKMLEAIEKKPIGNVRLAMKLKGKWARDGFRKSLSLLHSGL